MELTSEQLKKFRDDCQMVIHSITTPGNILYTREDDVVENLARVLKLLDPMIADLEDTENGH